MKTVKNNLRGIIMSCIFDFISMIFTLDSQAKIRIVCSVVLAIVLGFILCKFTSKKIVICVMCASVFVIILGALLLLSGDILALTILTYSIPFFVVFLITVGLYYFFAEVRKQINQAKNQLK